MCFQRAFGLTLTTLLWAAGAEAQNAFDQAERQREIARQRAFERGQKTELPARESREEIGRLPTRTPTLRDGPPAADVYNRVMETARHFRHSHDPQLRNVNDTFTSDPAIRMVIQRETERLYPDLKRPGSDFSKRQASINRWIDMRSPPLAKDARRELLVAHMVSLELTGSLRLDDFGLGQIPQRQKLAGAALICPNVALKGSFEFEVEGTEVRLPGDERGSVTRGQDGAPDVIRWIDCEGGHTLRLPQTPGGIVYFSGFEPRRYVRIPGVRDSYRVRFSRP
jgi:hypothetical protein